MLHAFSELLVAVDEGVVAAEMVMDLFNESFNSGQNSAQSAVIQLQLHLWDFNIAGFALEEVALEVLFVLNVEGEHECLLADFAAVLGFGGVVSAVVAGETHNDEVGEVRHAGAATGQLARHEADFAVHFELYRLVIHEIFLLEGLYEVELVAVELPMLLVLHLLLHVAHVVAHRHQLFLRPLEAAHLHVLIDFRGEWVFDVRVSAWVTQLEGDREVVSF